MAIWRAAKAVEPAAVLALVSAFAATTLIASQFADYSSVQVLTVRTATRTTGSAHAYVLVAVGAVAIVAASQALGNRRWRLGRLIGILGIVAVVVSLAVDLSQGVDPGGVGERYAQATASLAGGFWEQLISGITLAVCGPLMARAGSRQA
jgi:hypothetical protein